MLPRTLFGVEFKMGCCVAAVVAAVVAPFITLRTFFVVALLVAGSRRTAAGLKTGED